MAKKNFKSGIDLLLQGSKYQINAEEKAVKGMSQPHNTKATYYFNTETLQSIKAIAYYEKISSVEVVNLALRKHTQIYQHLDTAKKTVCLGAHQWMTFSNFSNTNWFYHINHTVWFYHILW